MRKWTLPLITSLLAAFVAAIWVLPVAAEIRRQTIYGEDSRKEVVDLKFGQLKRWVDRTVALVEAVNLVEGSNGVRAKIRSLGEEYRLCRDERFYHQPSLSFCTGFFIAPHWVATARHCVEEIDCSQFRMLRDYKIEKSPDWQFTTDQVLVCNRIIQSKREDIAFLHVVEPGAEIPDLKSRDLISASDLESVAGRLEILGFPLGLPMKWAEGNSLYKLNGHLYADIDSFEGNSGSPILDQRERLMGLLIAGDEDFELAGQKACQKSYRCKNKDHCEGEEILSVDKIREEFDRLISQ